MRVVIDCNVLVSAARSAGVCREVIVHAVRDHHIVLSDPIVREYKSVAERTSHAAYREGLSALIEELESVAVVVEPADVVFNLRDSDDEVYLQTATAAGAVVVTGNRQDFREPRYGSVVVFSPRWHLGPNGPIGILAVSGSCPSRSAPLEGGRDASSRETDVGSGPVWRFPNLLRSSC